MWTELIKLLIRLTGMILDKMNADKEIKQSFFNFVLSFDVHKSVKLHKSYQEQLEKLKNIP